MVYLRALAVFIFMSVAYMVFAPAQDVAAAYNYTYPQGPANSYVSVSRSGASIYLDAPIAYLKMKYSPDAEIQVVDLHNMCFTAGIDAVAPGGCTPGYDTIWVCRSEPDGSFNPAVKNQPGGCFASDPGTWGANGAGTQRLVFRNPNSVNSAWPLDSPIVDGYRNLYLVVQHHVANGANGFRVTTYGLRNNLQPATYSRVGFGATAGAGLPMSITHLPLGGGDSNYQFVFKIPCNYGPNNFRLGWFDADRGAAGIPQDYNINFQLVNVSTNPWQALTSGQFAFLSSTDENNYLGGQSATRGQTVTNWPGTMRVQSEDVYVWNWNNVNNNNGVQVILPFDEPDVDVACPPPSNDQPPTGTVQNTCQGIRVFNAEDPDVPNDDLIVRVYAIGGTTPFVTGIVSGSSNATNINYTFAEGQTMTVEILGRRPNGTHTAEVSRTIDHTWNEPDDCPQNYTVTPTVECVATGSRVDITFRLSYVSGTHNARARITNQYRVNSNPMTTQVYEDILNPGNPTSTRIVTLTNLNVGDEIYGFMQVELLRIGNRGIGTISPQPTAGSVGDFCEQIRLRPSIEVNGADVWAGGSYSMDIGNFCPTDVATSGVNTNPSRASYAAFAVGDITGFGTAGSYNSNLLAFANDGTRGQYNTEGKCALDYYQFLDKPPAVSAVPSFSGSGTYFVDRGSGTYTLPNVTLGAGQKITVIVNGNVDISNNVQYNYSGVSDMNDIPSFVLVVGGNINIRSGVTRLDGMYVAGTDDPTATVNTGVINTCANEPPQLFMGRCGNLLTVNGAFSANKIEFRRTRADLDTIIPAEVFNMSPQFFLSKPLLDSVFTEGFEVTSQRDLPPVY